MARLKLNKEEISIVEELQGRNNTILRDLGDTEAGLRRLNTRKDEIFEALDELYADDLKFGEGLTEKYGKGFIDFQKNEYITE